MLQVAAILQRAMTSKQPQNGEKIVIKPRSECRIMYYVFAKLVIVPIGMYILNV